MKLKICDSVFQCYMFLYNNNFLGVAYFLCLKKAFIANRTLNVGERERDREREREREREKHKIRWPHLEDKLVMIPTLYFLSVYKWHLQMNDISFVFLLQWVDLIYFICTILTLNVNLTLVKYQKVKCKGPIHLSL